MKLAICKFLAYCLMYPKICFMRKNKQKGDN